MKRFNLNNYILIQITEYGWEYLHKNYEAGYITHCIVAYREEIEGEAWYKLQAHEVISLFGNALWIASHSPISTNILVP